MLTSSIIQKALEFAYKVHQVDQRQNRKGKQIPYLYHVLSVAAILERVTDNEEVIAAGLLHDTLEDSPQDRKVTFELIEKEFGLAVATMVYDVTEKDKSKPWQVRKQEALEHISNMDRNSLLVKSADVLHNMQDQIEDYRAKGNKIFRSFNATMHDQIARYGKLLKELERVWPDNPLLPNIRSAMDAIQKEWH